MHMQITTNRAGSFSALRERAEGCRRSILGRLARRVRSAALTVSREVGRDGAVAHLCELEMHTGDGQPLRLHYRGGDPDHVIAGAFRRARAALIRRARSLRQRAGERCRAEPVPVPV